VRTTPAEEFGELKHLGLEVGFEHGAVQSFRCAEAPGHGLSVDIALTDRL
jgi:hypothetical protein